MGKSKRLMELMMVVNQKKRFTAQELADEFSVSYRTMLRDLQELSELGVPLYSEPGLHGGYRIIKERILPPIAFSENETIALFFINESLRYYGGIPFEVERESILRKFHHYLPKDIQIKIEQLKDRVIFWNPFREQSTEVLGKILETAMQQKAALIVYSSNNGTRRRKVQFVGLYAYNGFWYCPAFCFEEQEFRLFRGDRIERVVEIDSEGGDPDLSHISLMEWLKEEEIQQSDETLSLQVQFTVQGVRRFSSNLMFGSKIIINEDGSGYLHTLIAKSQVQYCAEQFFALGKEAKVIVPIEIIQELKEKAKEIWLLYKE